MINKLTKENEEFVKMWEEVRKQGAGHYVLRQMAFLGVMMLFIYIIDLMLGNMENYLISAIIKIAVAVIMPILGWKINEARYKKCKRM